MMRVLRVLPGLLLLATAVACGGKAPPTHYYTLQLPAASDGAHATTGLDAGVNAFHVDPPYDQDRIVYRVGDDSPEIGFYAYHRWAAPLSRMLPALVAERFRGAGGIGTVEPAAPGRRYAARIDGRLTMLEEIDLAEGQRIRLRMTLSLREADGTLRWREELEAEAATDTEDVRAIVEAMGTALSRALDDARDSWERSLR
jgi:ABC-type uncharacterized transport system auxiliary subunit